MRTFIIILAILFPEIISWGQNKIQSYEYWFNGNYVSKQQIPVTPVAQFTLNTAISTNTLPDGLHMLNVRFKDDSARYSSTISQFFYKHVGGAAGTTNLNGYQYWFDNNFAAAVLQSVTPTSTFNLNIPVSAAALTNGLHLLHMRFRDNSSQWSSTISQFFYKSETIATPVENQMTAYQYWFDVDFGNAAFVSISPSTAYQLSAAISTASLSPGLHLLNVRFKDQHGQWSATISQFVYTANHSSGLQNNLMSQMQYWFDNDMSGAQMKPLNAQAIVQVTDMIDSHTLPDGLHILHVRFADSVGQWSSAISQFFYKSAEVGITTNVISGYRYWFNEEGASAMIFHGVPEQNPLMLNTSIDMGCLTLGANRLHIQFLDKTGLWSTPLTDTITLISTQNIYRFTGNGNWSNAANWLNNAKPALDVPGCKEIIIDHAAGGSCVLDIPQNLMKNAKITVLPGKKLVIPQTFEMK
jgi:hypothetical protein